MSRSRLGHQAAQTFDSIPEPANSIDAPAWLVLPLLYWSRVQLACLEIAEPYLTGRNLLGKPEGN